MRCDYCPLGSDEDVCPEAEGKYGIEHKDGVLGCTHPWNWVKKRDDDYCNYLGDMGTDMGIEMSFTTEELNRAIELCKHMVGLDHKSPYLRHGKAFYKPYRNYYCALTTGIDVLDRLTKQYIMDEEKDEKYTWYSLTDCGLKWLGRQLNIIIKPETEMKEAQE